MGTRYFVIEPGTIINQTIRNLAAIANAPNFMIGVPRRLPPGFPDPIPPYPFVYEEPDPVPVDTSVRDNAVAEWEAFKARGTATTAQIRELLIKVLPHLDENTFR